MSRDSSGGSPPEDGRSTDADADAVRGGAAVDDLEARIAAVERACSEGGDARPPDHANARPSDRAGPVEPAAKPRETARRLDELDDRVADLESATQALRGYVGSIRAVNERVERRADRAVAATRADSAREHPDVEPAEVGRPRPERRAAGSPAVKPTTEGRPVTGGAEEPDSPRTGDSIGGEDEGDVSTGGGGSTREGSNRGDAPDDSGNEPLVERLRDAL